MKITTQDRANIRRIITKIAAETDGKAEAKAKAMGIPLHPEMKNIVVAQNAMRVFIEEILIASTPYSEMFLAETTVRVVSYLISAAPIESHQELLRSILQALPDAYRQQLMNGSVIKTVWETDGVERDNIPSKGDLQ